MGQAFNTLVALCDAKDIEGLGSFLHEDYMFILDYDFMTKEDWLKWVNEEFKKPEPFLSNPVLTLEDEHLCIFNQTFELVGKPTMSINTTHLKDGKPWRTMITRVAVHEK